MFVDQGKPNLGQQLVEEEYNFPGGLETGAVVSDIERDSPRYSNHSQSVSQSVSE